MSTLTNDMDQQLYEMLSKLRPTYEKYHKKPPFLIPDSPPKVSQVVAQFEITKVKDLRQQLDEVRNEIKNYRSRVAFDPSSKW